MLELFLVWFSLRGHGENHDIKKIYWLTPAFPTAIVRDIWEQGPSCKINCFNLPMKFFHIKMNIQEIDSSFNLLFTIITHMPYSE